MICLTSITERNYCAAWQPLTSANQESGSANPSEVTLAEGEAAPRRALWQRACSEALLQPGRGGAQEGQLGMQRRRRSCHRLCQLSHCQPHEEAEQSAAGPAIEGVWPWFGFRKGEDAKARLREGYLSILTFRLKTLTSPKSRSIHKESRCTGMRWPLHRHKTLCTRPCAGPSRTVHI